MFPAFSMQRSKKKRKTGKGGGNGAGKRQGKKTERGERGRRPMRTISGRSRSRDGREAGVRLRPVPIDFPQTDQRQRHEDIHELPEGSAQRNLEERLKQQRQNARGNRQLFFRCRDVSARAAKNTMARNRTSW